VPTGGTFATAPRLWKQTAPRRHCTRHVRRSVAALRRIGRHPWRWFNSAIRTEEEIGATGSLQHNSCLRLSRPLLTRASDCRAEDAADSGA
jgi:hypothetical protein